jgi:menaquinone-9 beta-reductase
VVESVKRYDVIIAGSGPAGLAAAHVLCSAGMKVALIDRCTFPREKLCGGLLSTRTRTVFESIFGEEWGPGIETETCSAQVFDKKGLLASVDDSHPLYLTSRKTFDSHLLALTEKKGPDLFFGSQVISINHDCQVSLRNGMVLTSDFIIGADGVTSRVREGLFPGSFDKNRYALCLQADVPYQDLHILRIYPEVYFGFIKWGYGWVFPKKDSLSIGIGGSLSRNRGMKNIFIDFYRHISGKEPHSVKGHYMPFGDYLKEPGRRNILLAGDAAGLVDPITGEGIAFAMQSGKYAAESILQAAQAGKTTRAYEFYKVKYNDMVRFFKPAKLIRLGMFPGFSQARFIKAMSSRGGAMILKNYMDVIAGRKTYYGFCLSILRGELMQFFLSNRSMQNNSESIGQSRK